ncbi:hypothetical protein [Thalassotalea sp. ND16A]|uniref:hypothetical protein n=1 Tax=Thalassotalea sp. ND16A TaxID=1535422 RepID=UPI00051A1697|nr:hypothetical protein [Thalassotalea sp. ND16A]KGJ89302.1 hypothetical protein ND16A_2195 [Thalassotalea sp. ND16A]
MQSIKRLILLSILSLTVVLSGCSDPYIAQIQGQTPVTEQRIAQLGDALANGQVRNANLINQYAAKVLELKPDLQPLIAEFKKDASIQGPMYLALLDRVNTVKNQPQMFADNKAIYQELMNIYQAADPVLYSDALSDPLNVLADMSDGALPRINSQNKAQSLIDNNAQDFGVGSQLVGNPSYGQWQTNSSGMSFWAWYGMYSMMGNMFGGNRIYYDSWGRNRGYSYYNDYGRSRYTSPSNLRKQNQVETRTRKSFASKGQKFTSTYNKNRSGSSGLSKQSQNAQKTASKFRSNSSSKFSNKSKFASKSKYSKKPRFRKKRKSFISRGFRRRR